MGTFKTGDEPVPGYCLEKFLGQGGFGEVWKAVGPGAVHVALKLINLDRKQGLKEFRALRLVKGIHHPNLVPIMGSWLIGENGEVLSHSQLQDLSKTEDAKQNFAETVVFDETEVVSPRMLIIGMGLGDCSLGDQLDESPSGIPVGKLLEYFREAAKAIDFMNEKTHDLGEGKTGAIQHCDIKPHNILVVGGSAQVCDFGLARVLGDARKTSMGVSPAYGAPECLDGNKPSSATDQYSLAISYIELRTGNLPFEDAGSYMAIVNAHLDSKLDLSLLPSEERRVIEKATSREPEDRYESASAMVYALREAVLRGTDVPESLASSDWETPSRDTLAARTTLSGEAAAEREAVLERNRRLHQAVRRWSIGVGVLLVAIVLFVALLLVGWRVDVNVRSEIAAGEYQRAYDDIESTSAFISWTIDKKSLRDNLVTTWESDVDSALSEEDWETAANLLTATDPWMGQLVDQQRRKRTDVLKDQWSEEFQMAALRGQRDQSEEIRLALLARFPDFEAAQQPAPGRTDAGSLPPDKVLRLVKILLAEAWQALDENAAEGAKKCLEAQNLLEMPMLAAADDALQQEAKTLRRECLLLGCRASARLSSPQWSSIRDAVDELAQLEPSAAADPQLAGQRALTAAIALRCEDAAPSLGFADSLRMIDGSGEQLDTKTEDGDRWVPTTSERNEATAARQRIVDRLRNSVTSLDNPQEAITRCDALLKLFPSDARIAMTKADMQGRLKQFDARLATLEHALTLSASNEEEPIAKQIAILQGLKRLASNDVATDDGAQAAVLELADARDKMMPEVAILFAERLANVAGNAAASRELRGECIGQLADLAPVVAQSPALASAERTELQNRIASLQEKWREENRKLISQLRGDVVTALEKANKPDFEDLLAKSKAAQRNGVNDPIVKLCLAECSLETATKDEISDARQRAGQLLAGLKNLAEQQQAYASYIRACLASEASEGESPEPKISDAADLIEKVYEVETTPILANEYRKRRASGILLAGAAKLGGPTPEDTFESQLTLSPLPSADAARVCSWLLLAKTLAAKSTSSTNLLLARAALAVEPTPKQEVADAALAETAAKVTGKRCTRDDVAALVTLIAANSPPAGQGPDLKRARVAVDAYAELLRLAQRKTPDDPAESPIFIYTKILTPALEMANKLGDLSKVPVELRKAVGAMHAEQGRLLQENPYENWKLDKPRSEVAIAAFERAIALDPVSARAHAGYGSCLLEKNEYAKAEAEAKKAILHDDKYRGGHALLGNIRLKQSRDEKSFLGRVEKLREAVAACTKAIDLSEVDDRNTAYSLINRSAANVEICDCATEMSLNEKAELLEQARDDAVRAIKIDTGYNDFAYVSLGNALEDMAHIAKKDTKNYAEAIAAFSKAIELSPHSNPRYLLARARCAFRAVRNGKLDAKLLDTAVNDLNTAIQREPDLGVAHYYLGRIHRFRKEYAEAAESFAKAAELDPTDYATSFYLGQAMVGAEKYDEADKAFANAVRLAREAGSDFEHECLGLWVTTVNPDHPASAARLATLAPIADALIETETTVPQTKLFVGMVRELQKKWEEAAKAYGEGLALPEVAQRKDLKYRLLYRRSKANYQLADTFPEEAKRKEIADKIGEAFYQDAEQAATVAGSDTERAAAMAQAAHALAWLAKKTTGVAEKKALWEPAEKHYREAIRLAPKHPLGWTWRFGFVVNWATLDPDIDRAEAIRYLDEVLQSRGPTQGLRDRIGRLKAQLQK